VGTSMFSNEKMQSLKCHLYQRYFVKKNYQ